jgi:hypothetical protein
MSIVTPVRFRRIYCRKWSPDVTPVEVIPMATVKGQGKSAFVKELLLKNEQANTEAVNVAWKAAEHEGTISPSLVQHVRSEIGLAGNIKTRRKPAEGNGASEQPPAAPEAKKRATGPKRKAAGPSPKTNGKHAPEESARQAEPPAKGDDRIRVLVRLEGEIDDMIHEVKVAGGLPEFEEALRKARRILARSHGE